MSLPARLRKPSSLSVSNPDGRLPEKIKENQAIVGLQEKTRQQRVFGFEEQGIEGASAASNDPALSYSIIGMPPPVLHLTDNSWHSLVSQMCRSSSPLRDILAMVHYNSDFTLTNTYVCISNRPHRLHACGGAW